MQIKNKNQLRSSLALASELSIHTETVAKVESYLNTWLEENDYFEDESVHCNTPFAEMGLSSIDSVGLLEDLKSELDIKLDATAAWRFPNVTKLAKHVAELKVKQIQNNRAAKESKEPVITINKNVATTLTAVEDNLNVSELALELEKLIYQQGSRGESCD